MSRIGPSTTVAFGHEWMSNTFIWGIKHGKVGTVFNLKHGPIFAYILHNFKPSFTL